MTQIKVPRNKPPTRVLLGSDGAPSPYANTRYYALADGEILIVRHDSIGRISRETAISDLRGRLTRLEGYANADRCREQMMSAIGATIEALETMR